MMLPEFTTLPRWAASLVIDFPEDQIPALDDESAWKRWGNVLVQETSFLVNNAPGTDGFKNWKDWAAAVYSVMTDQGI